MRNIIVLGGSSSSGLVNRLAAELLTRGMTDVNVILAESEEQAMAAADKLATVVDESDAVKLRDNTEILVIGSGNYGHNLAGFGDPFELYTVSDVPAINFVVPQQNSSQYWQQGNHSFDRKQQSMKAKARRR